MAENKWFQRRSDLYHVSPNDIVVVEGWNDRVSFDLDDLVASIRQNGVMQPLMVRRNRHGVLELRNGERRLRAVRQLLAEGVEILSVPVILEKSSSDAEALIASYLANTGKPFEPMEEAHCFRRFLAWGWSPDQLAQRLGKSVSTVRNSLALLDAAPAVVEALQNGTVSRTEAVAVVRQARRTEEDQSALLEERQEAKREKKAIKRLCAEPPPPHAISLDARVAALCDTFSAEEVVNAVITTLRALGTAPAYVDALQAAQDIAAHQA